MSGVGVSKDRPTVIALGLVERDGRFLVQHRATEPFRGVWEFPGGKLEWGESLEDAVRRECREECGFDVDVLGLADVVSHYYAPDGPHVVLVAYRCRPRDPDPPLREGARWMGREELARIEMLPANRRLVERLVREPM